MATKERIHMERLALDTKDLQVFCKKNQLPYAMCKLKDLDSCPHLAAYIHTGEQPDEYNGGHINHWLFIYGDLIFDSYGKYSSYKFGSKRSDYEYVRTHPTRLQSYNTTVCGEYCSMFYWFMRNEFDKENSTTSASGVGGATGINTSEVGMEFSEFFSFSTNTIQNDKIAFDWFLSKV